MLHTRGQESPRRLRRLRREQKACPATSTFCTQEDVFLPKATPTKNPSDAIPNPHGARTGRKLRPPNRAQTLPKPRARGESIEPGTAFSKRGKALPPRAHARKRVLPIRPSASCLWGISCVPEARPLQDVNRVSMIHLATFLLLGFPKGPAGPFWPCGRRVGIGGGFSVPFWRQKGTCNASRPAGAGSSGQARSQNQISQAAKLPAAKTEKPAALPSRPSPGRRPPRRQILSL